MHVQLQAQSGGFSLPIPAAFASALHLTPEMEVEVTLADGILTVTPRLQLAELLAQVTPENLHEETNTGLAQGGEAW